MKLKIHTKRTMKIIKKARVINEGASYISPSRARELGVTKYHYWLGLPMAKNGDVLEVVKTLRLSNDAVCPEGCLLKDAEGIEYIINNRGLCFFDEEVEEEEEKKLIGYKLRKPEYAEIACKVEGFINFGTSISDCKPILFSESAIPGSREKGFKKIEDANLLDFLFEPVYEESFILNKWYKHKEFPSSIVYVTSKDEKEYLKGYGCNFRHDWCDNREIPANWGTPREWEPASKEEVKTMLVNEAEKRGYKRGVRVVPFNKDLMRSHPENVTLKNFDSFDEPNQLWYNTGEYNAVIFENGNWAKIVKDELPTIYGYKGEFILREGIHYVKYGCAEIRLRDLRLILKFGKYGNREILSITLDSKKTLTRDIIKKIIEAFEEYVNNTKR